MPRGIFTRADVAGDQRYRGSEEHSDVGVRYIVASLVTLSRSGAPAHFPPTSTTSGMMFA